MLRRHPRRRRAIVVATGALAPTLLGFTHLPPPLVSSRGVLLHLWWLPRSHHVCNLTRALQSEGAACDHSLPCHAENAMYTMHVHDACTRCMLDTCQQLLAVPPHLACAACAGPHSGCLAP